MKDVRYYNVGDAKVTRIMDLAIPELPSDYLYPEWDAAAARAAAPWLDGSDISADDRTLALSVHSWLVEVDGLKVLVDTGVGNNKPRPLNQVFDRLTTPYLENLAAAGVEPSQIDYVVATHLHIDHVGWNTVLDGEQWVPTFPNAKYLFSRGEHAFYGRPANVKTPSAGVFEDSVQPIVEAGLAQFVSGDDALPIPGFRLHTTKGHSFDHLSVSLQRGKDIGFFSGDVMHHPVQVGRPEWNSVFCEFPDEARESRLWSLDFAAERRALFFSSHFPGTSVGTVERGAHGYLWQPR